MVMEYVEGKSLGLWLRNEGYGYAGLPIEARFQIAMEIAKGMEYLHDGKANGRNRPIIHRDLKPDNVMVRICVPFTEMNMSLKQ